MARTHTQTKLFFDADITNLVSNYLVVKSLLKQQVTPGARTSNDVERFGFVLVSFNAATFAALPPLLPPLPRQLLRLLRLLVRELRGCLLRGWWVCEAHQAEVHRGTERDEPRERERKREVWERHELRPRAKAKG